MLKVIADGIVFAWEWVNPDVTLLGEGVTEKEHCYKVIGVVDRTLALGRGLYQIQRSVGKRLGS